MLVYSAEKLTLFSGRLNINYRPKVDPVDWQGIARLNIAQNRMQFLAVTLWECCKV